MKNLLTTALLLMATLNTWAQDILFFHDGRELQAKVTEVGANEVKYHRFDNLDGPVFVSPKAELFMIKYKNGTKEMIQATAPAATQASPAPVQQAPQTFSQPSNNRHGPTANALIQRENQVKYNEYRRLARKRSGAGIGLIATGGAIFLIGAGMFVREAIYKDDMSWKIGLGGVLGGGIIMGMSGIAFKTASKYRKKANAIENGQACISPSLIHFQGHHGGVGQANAYGLTFQYKF
jgi:hypothetical protein